MIALPEASLENNHNIRNAVKFAALTDRTAEPGIGDVYTYKVGLRKARLALRFHH